MKNKFIFIILSITLIYSEIRIVGGMSLNKANFQDGFSILEAPYFEENLNFSEDIQFNSDIMIGFETHSSNGITGISYMSRGFQYNYNENYFSDEGIITTVDIDSKLTIVNRYLGLYYIIPPISITEIWTLLGIKQIMNPNSNNNTHFLFGIETGYFLSSKMISNESVHTINTSLDGELILDMKQKDTSSEKLDRDDWNDINGDIFDAGLLIGLSYDFSSKISSRITYYYGVIEPKEDELTNWSTINMMLTYLLR